MILEQLKELPLKTFCFTKKKKFQEHLVNAGPGAELQERLVKKSAKELHEERRLCSAFPCGCVIEMQTTACVAVLRLEGGQETLSIMALSCSLYELSGAECQHCNVLFMSDS